MRINRTLNLVALSTIILLILFRLKHTLSPITNWKGRNMISLGTHIDDNTITKLEFYDEETVSRDTL